MLRSRAKSEVEMPNTVKEVHCATFLGTNSLLTLVGPHDEACFSFSGQWVSKFFLEGHQVRSQVFTEMRSDELVFLSNS